MSLVKYWYYVWIDIFTVWPN